MECTKPKSMLHKPPNRRERKTQVILSRHHIVQEHSRYFRRISRKNQMKVTSKLVLEEELTSSNKNVYPNKMQLIYLIWHSTKH